MSIILYRSYRYLTRSFWLFPDPGRFATLPLQCFLPHERHLRYLSPLLSEKSERFPPLPYTYDTRRIRPLSHRPRKSFLQSTQYRDYHHHQSPNYDDWYRCGHHTRQIHLPSDPYRDSLCRHIFLLNARSWCGLIFPSRSERLCIFCDRTPRDLLHLLTSIYWYVCKTGSQRGFIMAFLQLYSSTFMGVFLLFQLGVVLLKRILAHGYVFRFPPPLRALALGL